MLLMESENIKNELHKYIDNTDEESLNILHEVIVSYLKSPKKIKPIVPKTKEEYIAMIKKSGEAIKRGEVYTSEEVDAFLEKKYAGKI
jgi:hypothetical protein